MMDKNNIYNKPLQAFSVLVLVSAAVATGRYFSSELSTDIIVNFSPVLAALFFSVFFKLSERFLTPAILISSAFLVIFSLWGYQQFLILKRIDFILLLGFTLLLIWYGVFSKLNIFIAIAALISLLSVFKFTGSAGNILLIYYAVTGGLSIVLAAYLSSLITALSGQSKNVEKPYAEEAEPFFSEPVKEPEAEAVISILPVTDEESAQDWGLVIQNLYTVLKSVPDVDQMFSKTLQYLHKVIDYDAAAVGMIQDKAINKISELGPESMLHNSVLDWSASRLNEIKSTSSAVLDKQKYLGAENKNVALYRMDIPITSSNNMLGVISVFRASSLFNDYEMRLATAIVFHCMIALRQSRLQEEVKRLSVSGKNKTLFSREQFIEKSNLELGALSRPRAFSILIVEIDNFDKIKDQYGVEAGLVTYKKVATSLMSSLGDKDLLGRYGKEGFIILLHETDLLDAKKISENIRKKVEQTKIKIPDGVLSTTVSIGLTTVSDQNENMMSIIRKADMGLFVAKESGYNTVKVSL